MPAEPEESVCALVVTWRAVDRIAACLDALAAAGVSDVIVIDNGSTDGTASLLAGRRDVRVIRSEANLGFAGGVSLGLRQTGSSPFVLLVNDDAVVAPGAVEAFGDAASAPGSERVGAWTARLLLEPGAGGVQFVNSTGNVVLRDGRGADRDWLQPATGPVPDSAVFGFCGGAALLRREMLEDVGGFDERFFLYYEDTDLSWRMRLAGWEVRYVHEAVVVHAHAQSSGTGSPVFLFHNWRNRLLCLVKNAPWSLVLQEIGREVVRCTLAPFTGRWRTTGTRWRAFLSFLSLLPHALVQRTRIGRTARVSRKDVARLLLTRQQARVASSSLI